MGIPKIPIKKPSSAPVTEQAPTPETPPANVPQQHPSSAPTMAPQVSAPKPAPSAPKPPVSRSGILSRAKSVSQVSLDNLCIMINGNYGSGKTTLAATGPKPMLVLDVREEGTKSIFNVEGVDVLPIKSWADVSPENPESIYYALKNTDHGYKTIVFDTMTQLQNMAMEKVLEGTNKTLEDKLWQEWGAVNKMMTFLVLAYKELPLTKIFLCQERLNNNEGKAAEQLNPMFGPALSPGGSLGICPAMDVIGHIIIDESPVLVNNKPVSKIQHKLQLRESRNFLAKTRKPKEFEAPKYIVDASYDDIIAVIKGVYKESAKA